ncbi:LOW QUALITY PROTEIN: uncharacterized protein [Fopius arisanus]|uniref:LOW QUALITY PROTEIN: uncharacterized protein n=1 Tax=Fopius arisanus TaxID=64838 RepID=A0A9R1T019_9HYME|nr:PREDICTED: LOW QUALITY PROTEIN: uncharacterized protein LOC105264999 [Fopius arisanus]
MGNWQLEVVRMVGYIAFPVVMFHWFNQAENFSTYLEDVQKIIPYTPRQQKPNSTSSSTISTKRKIYKQLMQWNRKSLNKFRDNLKRLKYI